MFSIMNGSAPPWKASACIVVLSYCTNGSAGVCACFRPEHIFSGLQRCRL